MKTLIISALVALSYLSSYANTSAGISAADEAAKKNNVQKEKLSKEERKRRFLVRTGGTIIKPGSGKGKIALVDCSSGYSPADFNFIHGLLSKLLMVQIDIITRNDLNLTNASQVLVDSGAAAAVIVANLDPKLPTILSAPDSRWAFVNAAALPKGNQKLMRREAIRALAYCSGGSLSQAPVTLMGPFNNLKQLESLPVDQMPYDVSRRVLADLKYRGVEPYVVDFYNHACEQGWAPPPTNALQQAVWERVKAQREAKPSNPITIKPGQKPLSK